MGPDRAPQAFSWRDDLRAHLSLHGTDLSAAQWSLLDLYLERILRHNRRVNLTAASTPQEVALRHFADAFAALPVLRRRLEGAARGGASAASPSTSVPRSGARPRLLDLGSGAGYIGICIKIGWSEARVALFERSQKKFDFLNRVAAEMGLKDLQVHRKPPPEKFDAVLLRAVASPREAIRLGSSRLGPGGLVCLYASVLPPRGAGEIEVVRYRLPGEDRERYLWLVAPSCSS